MTGSSMSTPCSTTTTNKEVKRGAREFLNRGHGSFGLDIGQTLDHVELLFFNKTININVFLCPT